MKRILIIIGINTLCLIAFLVCQGMSASIAAPMHTGMAAKSWAGQSGERFAQLAVYFPYSYEFSEEKIRSTHTSLETSLLAVSLESGSERKLYTDAWSAESTLQATGERGSASASVIGVGGDFFLFHPLYLRDGSYILPGDVMRDRVVLDEELAWRLYGSINLAGLEVIIGGRPFHIAGVVSRESGFAYEKVYDGGAGLYMSYEALNAIEDGNAKISSYELVMPDIVTDFALSSLKNALKDANKDESLHFVDNTSRYDISKLFEIIGSFGQRSLHTGALAFPYWENAARYTEDWLALLLVISLVFLVCPAVFSVIYGIRLIRFGFRKGKDAVRAALRKREDRAYKKYMKSREVDTTML